MNRRELLYLIRKKDEDPSPAQEMVLVDYDEGKIINNFVSGSQMLTHAYVGEFLTLG